jgi:hypothetical protein
MWHGQTIAKVTSCNVRPAEVGVRQAVQKRLFMSQVKFLGSVEARPFLRPGLRFPKASRAVAVKPGRRPPAKPAHRGLDGGEHDATLGRAGARRFPTHVRQPRLALRGRLAGRRPSTPFYTGAGLGERSETFLTAAVLPACSRRSTSAIRKRMKNARHTPSVAVGRKATSRPPNACDSLTRQPRKRAAPS